MNENVSVNLKLRLDGSNAKARVELEVRIDHSGKTERICGP